MSTLSISKAIREGLHEEMVRDENVVVLGEDMAVMGNVFAITQGFLDEFGPNRVIDTPISESGFTGMAVGMAMRGLRPVVEWMYDDFITVCLDPVMNQAAKMRYMTGGQVKIPIVFRAPIGAGRRNAGQHSQCLEALFTHIPGLKVVCPSTGADAKGLLKSAIRCDDPVVFLEHKLLYAKKEQIPDGEYLIPLGKADVKRPGQDLTILTWSRQGYGSLEAAETRAAQGRAAAGIAVHLGQDHAGQGQILVEGFGHGHGILAGHGVGHEQNFLRLYGGLDVHQLLHERGVDVQAARRIEDDHGALLLFGVFERGADNVHGLHIRRRSKAGDVELPGERAELIDGGGTVHVHGNEIRPHFLLAQEIGELARRCGLTGTLKAHHHDDAGLRAAQVQFGCFAAEQGNEFVMHSFDELLRGGQAFFDFLAEHALTHTLHELLDDLEVDVGFQQGKTHLAQAIADIFLGELRPAAQGAERAGQPVR